MKFIKNNYLMIIACFCFIIYGFMSTSSFLKDKPKIERAVIDQQRYKCLLINTEDYCNTQSVEIKNRDTFSTFMYIINISDNSSFIMLGSPLFVIILSSICFHKYLRKGYLKNSMSRISYKNTITNMYLRLLKYALILPTFLILMFIVSYIISGNFDFELGVKLYGSIGLNPYYAKILPIFIITYIFTFFLHGIFWINLSIWNLRHNKNVLVSIIVSCIEFFLLAVIIEMIGVSFFHGTEYIDYFNMFYMWMPKNILISLLESVIFVTVSSLMVYFAYKDKEAVLEEISK